MRRTVSGRSGLSGQARKTCAQAAATGPKTQAAEIPRRPAQCARSRATRRATGASRRATRIPSVRTGEILVVEVVVAIQSDPVVDLEGRIDVPPVGQVKRADASRHRRGADGRERPRQRTRSSESCTRGRPGPRAARRRARRSRLRASRTRIPDRRARCAGPSRPDRRARRPRRTRCRAAHPIAEAPLAARIAPLVSRFTSPLEIAARKRFGACRRRLEGGQCAGPDGPRPDRASRARTSATAPRLEAPCGADGAGARPSHCARDRARRPGRAPMGPRQTRQRPRASARA